MVADIASDQAANKSLIVDMVDDSVPRMILFFWGGFLFLIHGRASRVPIEGLPALPNKQKSLAVSY